jgi:hypothetical protein
MSIPKRRKMNYSDIITKTIETIENEIYKAAMERGLAELTTKFQEMADAMPTEGSDGRRLRRTRRIGMEINTSLGKAKIGVICGQCKSTGGWETPFRDKLFRGERGADTPALERKIVTTACETGSFEKAAKVCGVWGCDLSDDKVMMTVRRVGEACKPSLLPKMCDCAAGKEDTLIIMMDG